MEQENKVMVAEEYERMKIETEHDKAEVQVSDSFDSSSCGSCAAQVQFQLSGSVSKGVHSW